MSSLNPSDIIRVNNDFRYTLIPISPYDPQIMTGRVQKDSARLYLNGPVLFGEYAHNGLITIGDEHYIAIPRDYNQDKYKFGGHPMVLVPLENCYYIKNKQRK